MLTKKQFDAIFAIQRKQRRTKTYSALHDLLVVGMPRGEVLIKHKMGDAQLWHPLQEFRRAVALTYVAITGQEPCNETMAKLIEGYTDAYTQSD